MKRNRGYYCVVANEWGETLIGNHNYIISDMAGFADLRLQSFPLDENFTFKTKAEADVFLNKYTAFEVIDRKVLDDAGVKRIMIQLTLKTI